MALAFEEDPKSQNTAEDFDWELVLAFIGAKKTNEPDFQQLFRRILDNPGHKHFRLAHQIDSLYDLTPIRAVGTEPATPPYVFPKEEGER